MIFLCKADFLFEAENLDDAFARLADHFTFLTLNDERLDPRLLLSGEIDIRPLTDVGTNPAQPPT